MAGLALSLAVFSAGLCLVRSRRRLAFGMLTFLVATATLAGIGCPGPQKIESLNMDQPKALEVTADGNLRGEAVVEIADNVEGVQVQINKDAMANFIRQSGLKFETEPTSPPKE